MPSEDEEALVLGDAWPYRDLKVLRGSLRQCWVVTLCGYLPCCRAQMGRMRWLGTRFLDGFVTEMEEPEPLQDMHLSELCLVRVGSIRWVQQHQNKKQHFYDLLCTGKAMPVPHEVEDVCEYLSGNVSELELPESVKQTLLVYMDKFLRGDEGKGNSEALRFQMLLLLMKEVIIAEVTPGLGRPQKLQRLGKWITWYVANKGWLRDAKFWAAVLMSKGFLEELQQNELDMQAES